jgi:D-glycero-D-manno-heptose 1,7-bisphosphate phosphatase
VKIDQAYVNRLEDFEFLPGAIEGMRNLQIAGYDLIFITSQSGLARELITETDYQVLTAFMRKVLNGYGIKLGGLYHCPHHVQGSANGLVMECDCRRPTSGLFLRAAQDLNISLSESFTFGDKPADIQTARATGVGQAYLLRSNKY